jgi:transitional endoplasmic reticulum ATPase
MGIDIPEIADIQIIKTFGGRKLEASTWETITESQPPKQIVNKRIILPLMEAELARKHAVVPPRTILFFGPPGHRQNPFRTGYRRCPAIKPFSTITCANP